MKNDLESEENGLWEEGGFIKQMSKEELEKKKKSIDMTHDEDINYNCKKCNRKISLHNRDWHDGMCDECFDETYYPKSKKKEKK
jgi:hypothetical protein